MMGLGDIVPGQILYFPWPTNAGDGSSITRATNGQVRIYKDDSDTQSTTGITDTEDFDGLTGVHMVKIDTSADGTFYAAGHDFSVVLQGAVIDGKTVNTVLATFSIANRSALRPATAGRTLVVDAAGLADANVVKLGPSGAGSAQTARDVGASVLVGDKTGFSLSAAGILAIWDQAAAGLVAAGSIGKRIVDFLTGDIFARLGAPALASVSADIDRIHVKTTNLPADPADASDVALDVAGVEAAVVATLAQATLARKLLGNKLFIRGHDHADVVGGVSPHLYLVIYDDDGTTPILQSKLLDKDGAAVVLQGTGPTSREASSV